MAASYPAATKTFREKENLAGLNYDSNNKRTLFVEDLTQIEDEVIAIEEELGAEVSGDAETLADRLDDMEAATAAVLSAIYPVGTHYRNETDNTNPATLLGFGTWSLIASKREIIQHGRTSIAVPTANSFNGQTVTFPFAFPSTARITVTLDSEATAIHSVQVDNITTTNFKIGIVASNTTTRTAMWIAVVDVPCYSWVRTA